MQAFEKKYIGFCKRIGGFLKSEPSKELKFAVNFLKWKIDPGLIVGAAKFSLLVGFVILSLLIGISMYIGFGFTYLAFLLFLPVFLFYGITEWPKMYMNDKAGDSLGFSPQIISQISIPLRMRPNLENALSIITQHGENEIVIDIKHMMWEIWSGKSKNLEKELSKMADKWGKFSKGFQRSLYLIIGSFHESNPKRKEENLDRAVNSIVNDISEKMHEYANSLNTPTLILFSLGIIVPLMVISIFPIVSFFGLSVGVETITAFLFISLIASFLYSSAILRKRPINFSLEDVKTDVPDGFFKVGTLFLHVKSIALFVFFTISFPSFIYLMSIYGIGVGGMLKTVADILNTHTLLWGICIGLTLVFYSKSVYKKVRRDRMKRLEGEFIDSLYHISNRLSDGSPIEVAIEYVSKIMKGSEIGKFYSRILNKIKRRSISLDKAIEEEDIDSDMVKSSLGMIVISLKDGSEAAAKTATVISSYMNRISNVNKSLNSMLDKNLSMMKTTAMFFAPIVCAVIVVLFQMITVTVTNQEGSFSEIGTGFQAPSIEPPVLQLIVGLYLFGLNYLLIRYVSRIQYGNDNVMLNHSLSRSFPITLIIFTITVLLTQNILLQGWLGL
jgi:hypothetical protein